MKRMGIAILAAVALAGCQSEAERLQAETLFHLENALEILKQTPGNTDAAVANLDKYIADNRLRMAEVRAAANALMARMTPEEREAFGRKALERAKPLRERLETLARTFPDPPRILAKIQELM